jgi:hypothetical protein
MDVARGASAVESVYVIGSSAVGLPQELNFAAHTPIYENRYTRTALMTNNALTTYNTNEINFLFNVINNFQRLRSYVIGMQFSWPQRAATTVGTNGQTNFTPLFGLGITYWDQIYLQLGSSQQALAPTVPAVHNTYMQKWTSFVDKTDENIRKWWEMAGFFDVKSFEYIGGIQGPNGLNTCNPNENPTLLAGAGGGWQGSMRVGTPVFNDLNSQGGYGSEYNKTNMPTNPAPALAVTPVRGAEGGLWIDPEMQRYRSMFYGTRACTGSNYLTKMGLISDIFESPLCIPGMQLSVSLKFNETNAARKRYVNTPYVIQAGDALASTGGADLIDQATFTGVLPNPNQFWIYSENIQFRSDIHGAFLLVFTGGKGLTDHMNYYDLYSKGNLLNIMSDDITLIQQGNNCPWESSFLFELQYPWTNVNPSGGAAPVLAPAVTVPPYMYTDVGVSQLWAQITTPVPESFDNNYWQTGARPNGMSPNTIANLTLRGVTDMWWWWRQMGYESQYFADTAFEDVTSHSLRDWLSFCNQPAVGSFPLSATVAGTSGPTIYGAFSVRTANGYTLGQGPHNQCWKQIWHPLGFVDKGTDYGVTVGSLRTKVTFQEQIETPIKFNHLGVYPIAVTYLGSGQVATNIRLK